MIIGVVFTFNFTFLPSAYSRWLNIYKSMIITLWQVEYWQTLNLLTDAHKIQSIIKVCSSLHIELSLLKSRNKMISNEEKYHMSYTCLLYTSRCV